MQNKLVFTDECIEIHCDRNDTETHNLVSQLYPVHKNRIGTLFKVSSRKAPEVLQLFRGITQDNIDTAPQRIQRIFRDELRARQETDMLLRGNTLGNPVVNDRLTLRPHQQVAREMARIRDKFGFFYDTRTGKTPLSLSIIYDDISKHPDHKWLVVCPLILIDNAWLEDSKNFFPNIPVVNCHARTKKLRLQAMQQNANIYIANTESFALYKEHYETMGFYGCIVDESSDMKSNKSSQSKALVDFATQVKKWYLLSGTPAPNGEWEYYMQLKSIDPYSVPQSYSQFLEGYFVDISFNAQYHKYTVRPDKKDELYELLRSYSFYVDKEDVLQTPGRTFHEVEYVLPESVKKAYTKMKNELYLELHDGVTITAPSSAAKLNKLNQLTSGFVIDTDAVKLNAATGANREEVHLIDDCRFKLLYKLLADNPYEQVLIWANYRKEFEMIKAALGNKCACVYGATSLQEKTEAIRAFKEKRIQYLVANPASADKGLTLTNCHICVYFSLNWSYETFRQSTERIYADISKQPKHCHYYIIMAKGTVDGILYHDVLQGKADASYAVLNHLKADL